MKTAALEHGSKSGLVHVITEAFESFAHGYRLAESRLIHTNWIKESMVYGEFSEERDQAGALQEALRWVVEQTAPAPPDFPIGTWRPPDDPSWTDPRWWSYTLLRYKYIEPILPDDYFEGTRLTGTLIARMGLPGRSAYYTELDRALKLAASIVERQFENPRSARIIRRRLLTGLQRKLEQIRSGFDIMGIASIFFRAFPTALLQQMADRESITGAFQTIERLVVERFLIEPDQRSHLMVPPVLRDHLYRQQPAGRLQKRHIFAAARIAGDGRLSDRIRHLQLGGDSAGACRLLLDEWGTLGSHCNFDELMAIFDGFQENELQPEDRFRVQICRGSHLIRFGYFEQARDLFTVMRREAEAPENRQLALIFLGHICSHIDPDSARRYFSAAREAGGGDGPFARFLYSSFGRFHLSRNDVAAAESSLLRARAAPEHHLITFTSVLLFALTDLHLMKGDTDAALQSAGELVDYAESQQDMHLSALALGTLAKVHMEQSTWAPALRYLEQSEALHRKRFNLNETARICALRGTILRRTGRLEAATAAFEEALDCHERIGSCSKEKVDAHIELVSLYDARDLAARACRHWQEAWRLTGMLGLHEAIPAELDRLRKTLPALRELPEPGDPLRKPERPESGVAMDLVKRHGRVSCGDLMEAAGTGRTTAYHVLKDLVATGRLIRSGRGRATRYLLASSSGGEEHHLHGWVMERAGKIGYVTSGMIARQADVSRATAKRVLAALVRAGRLRPSGHGRSTRYMTD